MTIAEIVEKLKSIEFGLESAVSPFGSDIDSESVYGALNNVRELIDELKENQ